MRRIIDICWRLCKQVPLLPITILAAIPLALLGEWRPWGEAAWVSHDLHAGFGWLSAFNPGAGQWIVIALVAYTIVVTVRGMIDDLRHGHVGVDLLAVVAIASTVAVQEYWAAWAVVLMISSGEAIEEFAQSKAESNLTALIDAAPRTAHVVALPGVRGHVHATGSIEKADFAALAARLGIDHSPKFIIREYIDNMPEMLAAADLVISRAGALTLAEIAAVGRASVLIPSPNVAENHQYHNAMQLQKLGAAVVVEEKELTGEKLIGIVDKLTKDPAELMLMGAKARALAQPDSLDKICENLDRLMKTTA